jgi:hypothetical protein
MTDPVTKKILSVVSALILAYIIRKWQFRDIPHGPDSNNVKKNIYHDDDIGCYKMSPVAHICPFHS